MIKKILKIFMCTIIGIMVIASTGCKKDSMEGITIYTTTYPIEYITNELYGEYSNISSIYPNEVIELSDKLLSDYSIGNLFVYSGLSNEKNYAVSMLNKNKDLMIVDATMGMEIEYSTEELWLNPSNFLMLSLNIKNGMEEYISNTYLRKQIDKNYNDLKLTISELDAEIKLLVENANKSTILVSNDLFKFFEKYGLTVISLENNSELTEKTISDAKLQITSEKIKCIIMMPNDTLTDDVETILANNSIEKLYFNSLTTISSEDESYGKDYISIMKENLEILKSAIYNQE